MQGCRSFGTSTLLLGDLLVEYLEMAVGENLRFLDVFLLWSLVVFCFFFVIGVFLEVLKPTLIAFLGWRLGMELSFLKAKPNSLE